MQSALKNAGPADACRCNNYAMRVQNSHPLSMVLATAWFVLSRTSFQALTPIRQKLPIVFVSTGNGRPIPEAEDLGVGYQVDNSGCSIECRY
ncbi:hypothetical protein ACTMU2_15050 [Cupriavidus basilensis]